MISSKSFSLLLSAATLFAACQPKETVPSAATETLSVSVDSLKALTGTWQLTAFSGNAKADSASGIAGWIQSGVYYSFFSDGRMCQLMGPNYTSGSWKPNADLKSISVAVAGKSAPLEMRVIEQNSDKLKLEEKTGEAVSTLVFQSAGAPLQDPKTDPFYPDHNVWRAKATAPESDAQLKDRLKNLVGHYICILEKALSEKQENVSFNNSPSLIQIFSGGIGVKEKKDLPQEWVNTFYSPREADQAVTLFTKWLQKTPSKQEATTSNWIQADLNILRRMHDTVW